MTAEAAVVVAGIGAAAQEGGLEGASKDEFKVADCSGLLQPWVLVHDLRLR